MVFLKCSCNQRNISLNFLNMPQYAPACFAWPDNKVCELIAVSATVFLNITVIAFKVLVLIGKLCTDASA
jgi:hypothetical protein